MKNFVIGIILACSIVSAGLSVKNYMDNQQLAEWQISIFEMIGNLNVKVEATRQDISCVEHNLLHPDPVNHPFKTCMKCRTIHKNSKLPDGHPQKLIPAKRPNVFIRYEEPKEE